MRIVHSVAIGGIIAILGFFVLVPGASAAPTTPVFQSATAVSSCAVELKWNQPDNADRFNFRVGSSAWTCIPGAGGIECSPGIQGMGGTGDKSFFHRELDPSRNYSYQLQACGSVSGCSNASAAQTASTPALPNAPGAPTTISLARWESNGGRAVLTWTPTASPSYSGFRVYRSDDAGANYLAIATIPLSTFAANGNVWSDAVSTDGERRYRVGTYQTANYCAAVDNATPDGGVVSGTVPTYVKFSAPSDTLIVPARPATVGIAATEANGTRVKFTWANVEHENTFQLQISDRDDFTGSVIERIYNSDVTTSGWIPDDTHTLTPEKTFYYRVRACAATGSMVACSDYRSGSFVSGRVGPRNVTATLVALGDTDGEVRVAWEGDDTASYEHETLVKRRVSGTGVFTLIRTLTPACAGSPRVCTYTSATTDRPARGERYEYEVTFREVGTGTLSEPAISNSVSLKVLDVFGWAWSSTDLGVGLGWFRLANNAVASYWDSLLLRTETPPTESIRYGVRVDEETGTLSGYAWTPYAGWLSFDNSNPTTGRSILDGCPASPCTAQVSADGTVGGWAKLLGANQWVSLAAKGNEPAYGLTYATTTWSPNEKVLSGYAWGGDGVGWIDFGRFGLPPPNLVTANESPTPTSLTLRWTNPVAYDHLVVNYKISTEAEFSAVEGGTITDPALVSQGSDKTITVGGSSAVALPLRVASVGNEKLIAVVEIGAPLTPDTSYTFRLSASKGGESVYSNEAPGRTARAGTVGYTLSCLNRTTSTLTMGWAGNVSGAHTLTLYRGSSEGGVRGGDRTRIASGNPPLTPTSGSYPDTGLAESTTYYYLLDYGTGTSNVVPCTTRAESSGTPSLLKVWARTSDTLLLNWKDNAVRPHAFTIERVKLTPRDASFADPKVSTVSDSALGLAWRNDSNRAGDVGPFFHAFERSTSAAPFADPDGDGDLLEHDPSYTDAVYKAFLEDTVVGSARNTYTWNNEGLKEGTTYHYRVRACSYVRVDLNKDGTPETLVCGGASGVEKASTKPAAPSNLTVTGRGTDYVSLSFRDNSGGEDGFELRRGGTVVKEFGASAVANGTVIHMDTGLVSGAAYSYTVRAYRYDPNVPTAKIYSVDSNPVNVTTNVTLSVANSPSAGGTVSGSGVNCGTSCSVELEVGDAVSLTASPGSGYAFSKWTGDACNDSTNMVCSFTVGADTAVTANFAAAGGGDGTTGETVSVKAYLNGALVSGTSFDFTLTDPGGARIASGITTVPFSSTEPDYPIGMTSKFSFYYNGGGPGTFQKITWSNSTGSAGEPTGTFTGQGFIGENNDWLEYRVYFISGGAELPRFFTNAGRWLAAQTERLERGIRLAAERLTRAFERALATLNVASARIEIVSVPGGGSINLEPYFARDLAGNPGRENLDVVRIPSAYEDKGLEANTVYLYRVKAVYTDGKTPSVTEYSIEGAGKTLPSGARREAGSTVQVCTRNSLCETKPMFSAPGTGIRSENQCRKNSDCLDVGTSRQFFQEAP